MTTYDRATQDVANIISLEHVNTLVSDQTLAHLFYVSGLGFTRDPYIDFGLRNMWVNLGRQQFHLPVGEPQVLRGATGVVMPDVDDLAGRLDRVAKHMEGTHYSFTEAEGGVDVTCPWGNRIEVRSSGDSAMRLGMPYVRFDVPEGTAPTIARFYTEILGAPAEVIDDDGSAMASVAIGNDQSLL